MKRFIFATLCAASVVAFSATVEAQSTPDENVAAFVGFRVDETGQRYGLVGIAAEIAPNIVSISRSDFGGVSNFTEEVGYKFSPTEWLSLMPFIGASIESEVSTSPITYITQSTGIAASITVDDFIGWGVWGAAKYVGGPDSYDDKWQFGAGVFFGI